MGWSYEILPRAPDLGGGWNLKLLRDGFEAGGGVFPLKENEADRIVWWNSLTETERVGWLRRVAAKDATATEVYRMYLSDEAYADAQMAGDEWLDGAPAEPKTSS